MPIYEFYCKNCHTVYNFFSRTVNNKKVPHCPRCKTARLKRQLSVVATITKRGSEGPAYESEAPFDAERMEKAMTMLSREAARIDEDDPRQAANLMRKLSETAGLKLGPAMEEALNRLERGEDPETLEAEMGDLLEGEGEMFELAKGRRKGPRTRPRVDETLYDL